jgi:rhodanese-related sulfurtransferase
LAQKLRQHGFRNAWALKDGYDAWIEAGLPLEQKAQAA